MRKIYAVKKKAKFSCNKQGINYKEEWLEEFLGSKGTFYNGEESDNDDESYYENNEQQQLPEGFVNSCCRIVSSILLQKLINDFAVCKHKKHFSGTLLLAVDVKNHPF